VKRLVGRQVKMWREATGLPQAEFGAAIGYGPELASKVERGARIPKAEFLDNADRVLRAGGRLSALNPEAVGATRSGSPGPRDDRITAPAMR